MVVVTSAKFYYSETELRFCIGPNHTRTLPHVCDGDNSRNSSSRLFSKACPENLQIFKVQVRTARTKRSGGLPIIN